MKLKLNLEPIPDALAELLMGLVAFLVLTTMPGSLYPFLDSPF